MRAGLALDGPDAELAWEAASEFGEPSCEPIEREVIVSIEEWLDPSLDLLDIDRRVHQTENTPFALRICWRDRRLAPTGVRQILTRYQRLFPRANASSDGPLFADVLALHRSLFDLRKPLVRSDYDHALDTWQWVLQLDPSACIDVQVSALFHDIERLRSEADLRIEHLAPDYQVFKDRHAEGGAAIVRAVLGPIDSVLADRSAALIAEHERSLSAGQLLADADALSFFSLNSPGFLSYFGPEHTKKKIRWTLDRMSSNAKMRLSSIRLLPEISAQLA